MTSKARFQWSLQTCIQHEPVAVEPVAFSMSLQTCSQHEAIAVANCKLLVAPVAIGSNFEISIR